MGWSALCYDGLERWRERMGYVLQVCASVAVRDVMCEVCSRTIRRQ